ncbi:hypothetical protein CVT24_001838 [Panaeolus cyanescens]|uniref:F-box domain-containing protein n=1 Tax=Panaeolus cyanescens TaxID=181874 RepID=A0A409YEW8_9AGAR|nr:hypothetical protein CVT24_001838 [Panaeolus cyanescens]
MSSLVKKSRNITIPNDILYEIINILADKASEDNRPARQQPELKAFHTLSSFCLHHTRKHIFAEVNLRTSSHSNWIPKHLPTLKDQVAFFTEHRGVLPYIHHLSLFMSPEEVPDSSLQAQLHDIMVQLSNMVSLQIDYDEMEWNNTPLTTSSIRSALQTLLHSSQNLSELYLRNVTNFCLHDLVDATYLQHLDVYYTRLFVDGDGPKAELNGLKELTIRQDSAEDSFAKALVLRDEDGNLVSTLPQLKALYFDITLESELPHILKVVDTHGRSLEELSLVLFRDNEPHSANHDYSAWLNKMVLPRSQTLRKIMIESIICEDGQDPFSGLCSTLSCMTKDNVLAELEVMVYVITASITTLGDEWFEISKVLDINGKWKHLEKVKLEVIVETCRPSEDPDGYLEHWLHGLRETHFKALFSQAFEFEYCVSPAVIDD